MDLTEVSSGESLEAVTFDTRRSSHVDLSQHLSSEEEKKNESKSQKSGNVTYQTKSEILILENMLTLLLGEDFKGIKVTSLMRESTIICVITENIEFSIARAHCSFTWRYLC